MRNYLVELLGTFFLIFAVLYTGNALAIGLIFMAMIYVGSHISGAHYNPAVSLAHWLNGTLHGRRFTHGNILFYFLAQIIGGALAAFLMYGLSGQAVLIEFPPTISLLIPAGFEALFTFLFCLVILTITSSDYYKDIRFHGIALGLTLSGIAFIPPLIVNPAVALGSIVVALVTGSKITAIFNALLVHVVPPLLGALASVFTFRYLNPTHR
jgi:glycerol uptake facilitator-like aquaporin